MPGFRFSPGCQCCGSGPTCQLCVQTSICTSDTTTVGYPGVTVTLPSGATCTTKNYVSAVTRVNAGSGYTNGTGYALTFVGGSPTVAATGTFDVVGGAVTNIILTSGGDYSAGSAPTVTFTTAGAGHGATASVAFLIATCCFSVPAGTYAVSYSGAGICSQSHSITVTCPTTNTGIIIKPATGSVNVSAFGCDAAALPGATVTNTTTGTTCTTSSLGACSIGISVPTCGGTNSLTLSAPRFVSITTSEGDTCQVQSWNPGSTGMTIAAGYQCVQTLFSGSTCPYPVSNTITVTDPNGDTTVLTSGGSGNWTGTGTFNFAGVDVCQAGPVPVTYTFNPNSSGTPFFTIHWTGLVDLDGNCCPTTQSPANPTVTSCGRTEDSNTNQRPGCNTSTFVSCPPSFVYTIEMFSYLMNNACGTWTFTE